MKITIDARGLEWYIGTGMGTYSKNLIEGLLHTKGQDYTFVFSEETVKNEEEPKKTVFGDTKNFWERVYEKPPKVQHCDVFHNPFNGFGIPYERDFPAVITLHDVIPLVLPKECGSPYREHFQEKIQSIADSADHIIAVSRHTKEDIITHLKISPRKITVIYQGIEPIFRPINVQMALKNLKNDYSLQKDYFLYVGGFGKRKNLLTLLSAFALVKDEISCDLVVVGRKGKSYPFAERAATTLGIASRVHFVGFVPREDLPLFYNAAKLFVYPSLYEGFGLPVLEAASCGTAVISSSAASLPEILGSDACYFQPQKAEDLAVLIKEYFDHDEERISLGKDAFAHSRSFSPISAARKTLGVYESLCR